MIHYELSVRGLWYDAHCMRPMCSIRKWQKLKLTLRAAHDARKHMQLRRFNKSVWEERETGTDKGYNGGEHREGVVSIWKTLLLPICVYFPTMLLVVIFQYQILLAWEILQALQQTAGVLSSLVTEQERGAAEPYWSFIWTHRGHIASLWTNIQLITLESGLTGRE